MPDEMLAAKAQDPRIIRNLNKVLTIRHNAMMIDELSRQHGSFSALVAQWPTSDIIGLWQLLKSSGARLGGDTGPYTLQSHGQRYFFIVAGCGSVFYVPIR